MRASTITRRACLAAVASIGAAPHAAALASSKLEELIADWAMANEEASALLAEADRIYAAADLPQVGVTDSRRRYRYPCQVHDEFDGRIAAWESDRLQAEFAPGLRKRRDALVAELERQEAALIDAERACGFTAAEALADRAGWRAWALREQIIAHQPADMTEVAAKSTFILQQMQSGLPPTGEELEIIFAAQVVMPR